MQLKTSLSFVLLAFAASLPSILGAYCETGYDYRAGGNCYGKTGN